MKRYVLIPHLGRMLAVDKTSPLVGVVVNRLSDMPAMGFRLVPGTRGEWERAA
jgi:hypothetical protein